MKTKSFIVVAMALLTLSLTVPFETLKADPPRWAQGYRVRARHIYFPQQNFYYDTYRNVYIYPDRGRWVTSIHLPGIFAAINLFTAPKVELRVNTDYPYCDNRRHIEMYRIRNRGEYYEGNRYRDDDRRRNDYNERDHDRGHRHGHDREEDD
ncbi:MAG: hypothetical protein P4L34_05310 [Paludibacter sp.]|nr:hypothetical protein [Paludibacter sp.]